MHVSQPTSTHSALCTTKYAVLGADVGWKRCSSGVLNRKRASLAVSAADDGAFSIPPADLGQLSPGLATLTITRERGTRRSFGDGSGEVHITTRVEVWGYLDLQ